MTETFKIYQVGINEAKQIETLVNEPHAHDFEELIIGIKGQLEHFIDFNTTVFNAPLISFITKGKIHRAQPIPKNDACEMWVIRFKSEFIPETTFQLYSLYHDNANLGLKPGSCFQRLVTLCEIDRKSTR